MMLYLVTDSNRLSPNFANISLRDKQTATECSRKESEKLKQGRGVGVNFKCASEVIKNRVCTTW